MSDFFIRTEDIRDEDILTYYVDGPEDRRIVDLLKSHNPVVLVGSRGVGKTILLRVAEAELAQAVPRKTLPAYVSFTRAPLLRAADPQQFHHWMLARISGRILRQLQKKGYLARVPAGATILSGGSPISNDLSKTRVSEIAQLFENSWKSPGSTIDIEGLPSVEEFMDAIEDLVNDIGIERISLFCDEAAHIFRPPQQRQFFTLFRDLRSPYLVCNAAVYPGVTAYGDAFQPAHDATFVYLQRDVQSSSYVKNMRDIIQKQAESKLLADIQRHGENFAILAYAATGNPRLLLKTLAQATRVASLEVNTVIKDFYRNDFWSEHSGLVDRYTGHKAYIDWGRRFVQDVVLPDLQQKNNQYLAQDKKTTAYFWVHRDAPAIVREALRLLEYTGIVTLDAEGMRATRAEIGTRYMVNLGTLFALEATPTINSLSIAQNLTPKRMSEYGANHAEYADLTENAPAILEGDNFRELQVQLTRSLDVLDMTWYQKQELHKLNYNTVGDVLLATEELLQQARYVGPVRSRRMRNAAVAAVSEYLSG